MNTTTEAFAIVPHRLTAHPSIEPSVKVILTHCLEKYQTKTDDGQPWTFSVPGIARGTGLSERTVRRHVTTIRKQGVLKLYGSLMNGKKRYDVFTFVRDELDTLISTADKLSVVIPCSDNGFDAVGKTTADRTGDKLSDKVPPKSKMVESKMVQERLKKEDGTNNQDLKSQPPLQSVAPENINGEDLAEAFEKMFHAS